MAPVWFVVDGGRLAFNTGKNTAKGLALTRDPRVVMCVDDPRPPYSFVQVQGIATIGDDPQEVLDIATRTGGRYMGADRAEEYGRRNGVPGELVVRIKPTKVRKAFNLAEVNAREARSIRPPKPRPSRASSGNSLIVWLRAKMPSRDAGSSVDIPSVASA